MSDGMIYIKCAGFHEKTTRVIERGTHEELYSKGGIYTTFARVT